MVQKRFILFSILLFLLTCHTTLAQQHIEKNEDSQESQELETEENWEEYKEIETEENWEEYEEMGGDENWDEYQEIGDAETLQDNQQMEDDEDWSEYEEVGGDGQTVEIVTQDNIDFQTDPQVETQAFETFTNFTPYYSSAGLVFSLTDEPSLQVGKTDEMEVYKDLFLRSFVPQWATIELSVYPMPLLGVGLKEHYRSTYDKFELSDSTNLIESATAGFEEPYSLTLLLNNVTSYNAEEESEAPNVGFMGYLVSVGTHHIQRNELVHDNWYELGWKVKGKFSKGAETLSWSLEVGSKNHSHNEITDTVYVGIKRDRINYDGPTWSFLENTGFELRHVAAREDFATVEQRLLVTKYFPKLRYKKMIFSLTLGVIHETERKYSGALALNQRSNQTLFVIRPSIYF